MWFEGFGWTCLNIFWKLPRRVKEIEKWREVAGINSCGKLHVHEVDEESFVELKVDRVDICLSLSKKVLLFLEKE